MSEQRGVNAEVERPPEPGVQRAKTGGGLQKQPSPRSTWARSAAKSDSVIPPLRTSSRGTHRSKMDGKLMTPPGNAPPGERRCE